MRDEKSTLNDVLQAVHELGLSHKYFQHLAVEGDRMKYDLARAAIEAKQCQDLLSQVECQNKCQISDENFILQKFLQFASKFGIFLV